MMSAIIRSRQASHKDNPLEELSQMTRKDYELVAAAIRNQLNGPLSNCTDAISASELAHELADELQTKNNRFDRDKFLDACLGDLA
jgi:hypothetical protein